MRVELKHACEAYTEKSTEHVIRATTKAKERMIVITVSGLRSHNHDVNTQLGRYLILEGTNSG